MYQYHAEQAEAGRNIRAMIANSRDALRQRIEKYASRRRA